MTRWWSAPELRTEEERSIGFLELFYDLIFVVAIAQLAHGLAAHPTVDGALTFGLLFAPVWWLWIGNTFYTDRFETNDISHRLFTFLHMLPIVAVSVFLHGARHETAVPFILAYVAGRGLTTLLWLRAGHHNPTARPMAHRLVAGFSFGIALWVASIWAPEDVRPWLWLAGVATDMATPVFTRKQQQGIPTFTRSRLAERFGLFVIIVLGESVAGTVNGLSEVASEDLHLATGVLAMAFAFALYWTCFEMVPRERLKPGFWHFMGRSWLQLPLLASLAATGAGVLGVVGHEGEVLADGPRRVLAWSTGLALLSFFGLSRVHQYQAAYGSTARLRTEASLLLAAAFAFVVGMWGGLGTTQTVGLLLGSLLVLIVWGIVAWARSAAIHAEQG